MRRSSTGGCCHGCHAGASPVSRGGWEIVAGALSLGVWVFIPKCPLCVAAHVALWTGLGFSFAEATYLRWSLLLLSGLVLCYLTLIRKGRIGRLSR
jgi:hypothetical protein